MKNTSPLKRRDSGHFPFRSNRLWFRARICLGLAGGAAGALGQGTAVPDQLEPLPAPVVGGFLGQRLELWRTHRL